MSMIEGDEYYTIAARREAGLLALPIAPSRIERRTHRDQCEQ